MLKNAERFLIRIKKLSFVYTCRLVVFFSLTYIRYLFSIYLRYIFVMNIFQTEQLKFSNASVLEEGIFYKVSLFLKSAVNFQCGTDLKVYCKVGRSNHYIKTVQPFMKCPPRTYNLMSN